MTTLAATPGEALVVMYHYVRDAEQTPFADLKALRLAEFDAQLHWLARRWSPVGYETFEATAKGSLPARASLLTFDDGFVDHYEAVYPALRARGWSGVFFVAGAALDDPPRLLNVHKTQFLLAKLGATRFAREVEGAVASTVSGNALGHRAEVYRYDQTPDLAAKHLLNYELPFDEADRVLSGLFADHIGDEVAFARRLYLSRYQIREMAAGGMTFGFHTESHRVLSRLDRATQRAELARGVPLLRDLTGQPSVPFCYPYGHPHTYTVETVSLLDELGYGMAFNTTRRLARPASDPRFEMPRFDTRDLPPFTNPEPEPEPENREPANREPEPEPEPEHEPSTENQEA
jgi:peptidoglycan/xylan/chitin deacetylase (PgdA/CDA1 family)